MRPTFRCLAFLLLSAVPAAAASGEANLPELARMLLDYQSYMRGDADAGVRFYINRAGEFAAVPAAAPLAELALRLALAQDPAGFSSVDVGETEARRLIAAVDPANREFVDLARAFVARTMSYLGRSDEAMAAHRQRGLAMSWMVAGPIVAMDVFRPEAGTIESLTGAIGPEDVFHSLPDVDDFADWRRLPPWLRIPEGRAFPFIHPWRWTGSGFGGAAVRTGLVLESPDRQAEFHVFSDVSWFLFIDGVPVASADRNDAEAPREHVVTAQLAAGVHDVSFLFPPPPPGTDPGEARFALRLASASPFAWTAGGGGPSPAAAPLSRREAARPGYLTALAALAEGDSSLRAAYALACAAQGMVDEAAWQIGVAAAADPDNPTMQVMAGLIVGANPLAPPDRRKDLAAAWHGRALAARPDLVPSLLFMAKRAEGAGQAAAGREYLARAFAANPASLQVLAACGAWAQRFDDAGAAAEAWRKLGESFPDSLGAQRAIASIPAGEHLDMDRRLDACRRAVAAGDREPGSLMRLADALADSGDVQAAAAAIREALVVFSGDTRVLAWAGSLYARLEMYGEASGALSEALRLTPGRADLWRTLGDVSREQGKEDLALAYWRTSMAANPGQHELNDMVRHLEGAAEPLQYDGEYDAVELVANAEPGRYPGDVVRLLDRSTVAMERDGSFRRLTHIVDLIQTRRGGEMLADVSVPGELLRARTIFPNGESLEAENISGRRGLRLPALAPGAAREIQYIEFFAAGGAQPPRQQPWYFQHPAGDLIYLMSRYEVWTPKEFPLVSVLRDHGIRVEFERSATETHDIRRWTARLGLSGREPDSVHVSERLASVEVGMRTSWDDVVRGELADLSGRLKPSREMSSLLAALCGVEGGGRLGPEDSARAVYRFVCDNIDQAVVASDDVASHILANRLGDRSLLLLAMLRALGFNAHPAAARPGRAAAHPPVWELPRRDLFPVPLVRLDLPGGSTLWLDTRFATLPFGKMADDLSEATAIAFTPDGPLFRILPRLPDSESDRYEERRLLLPAGDGVLTVLGSSAARGVRGLARREFMIAADVPARRQAVLESLFPVFPDAVLRRLDIVRPAGDEAFSQERYEISSGATVVERGGGVLAAPLCLVAPEPVSAESRGMRTRNSVCHVRENHVTEDRNTFVLPEGGRFLRLPSPANIPSNFGVYQLRVNRRPPDQVEIVRRFRFPLQRIRPWEWGDFLRFLDDIDLAERQWIEYAVD